MSSINVKLRKVLKNEKGDITIFTCFFVVGVIMLVAFLLLHASVQINVINIRNGAKMELNNLAASLYADTFRAQREVNFEEYMQMLYSSPAHIQQLEQSVRDGLAQRVPLSTNDYRINNISLEFNYVGGRVEYVFMAEVEFFIRMFGDAFPTISRQVRLTGHHNTKF